MLHNVDSVFSSLSKCSSAYWRQIEVLLERV